MGIHGSSLRAAIPLLLLLAWLPPGAQPAAGDQGTSLPLEKRHLIVQLTTQEPPDSVPGIPERVYPVDGYEAGRDIWVAIPPVVLGVDLTGEAVQVCVVPHRPLLGRWLEGTALKDVSGGVESTFIQGTAGWDNRILVWNAAGAAGRYDVIVDRQPFGIYNPGVDLLDHGPLGGFNLFSGRAINYLLVTPAGGCVRIIGSGSYVGGLYEPTEPFVAHGWSNGPDGIPDQGGGDDIYQGTVAATWSTNAAETAGRIHAATGLFIASNLTNHKIAGEPNDIVTALYPGATAGTAEIVVSPPSWSATP